MSHHGLTPDELMAESAMALPDKEVVSILDLNVDVDVFIDAAAPIDLSAAAQLNVAAPIDAAASANVLSNGSTAVSEVNQTATLDQILAGSATATAGQVSVIDQSDEADGDPEPTDPPDDGGTVEVGDLATLSGPLLNVDVNVDLDTDLAAPIAGAVAANANVAAPISASVAANVLSENSIASAVSNQDAQISQQLYGDSVATSTQDATIAQGTSQPPTGELASTATEAASASTATGDAGGSTSGDAGGSTSGDSGGTSGGTSDGSSGSGS
jgi:hypothetical protein